MYASTVTLPASMAWMMFLLLAGLIVFVAGPSVIKILQTWNLKTARSLRETREKDRVERVLIQEWHDLFEQQKQDLISSILVRAKEELRSYDRPEGEPSCPDDSDSGSNEIVIINQ